MASEFTSAMGGILTCGYQQRGLTAAILRH
jgi:hypothetical protein